MIPCFPKYVLTIGLSVVAFSLSAQQGGGGTSGGGEGSSQPDPIAIAAAHILKGQTNRQQRRKIKMEWTVVAAEQVEAVYRSWIFKEIVGFIEKNKDLFEEVYGAMTKAKDVVVTGTQAKRVVEQYRVLLLEFSQTGQSLTSSTYFTSEELVSFYETLDGVMRDTDENLKLFQTIFGRRPGAKWSDMERFEVLNTIEAKLNKNVNDVRQLRRFVNYLNLNRGNNNLRGLEELNRRQ